ncbi:ATP-grasp domain-containing protein [Bacillus sp. AK128]
MREETSNVLIMSISKKVPLIKAVKKALHQIEPSALVYGSDLDLTCIGYYFVDGMIPLSKINDINIADFITACKDHGIKFVIPTRDGELTFFAKHKEVLKEAGISVIVSNVETVTFCLDKYLFYKGLKSNDLPCIHTADSIDDLDERLFVVKERYGAGSSSIGFNLSKEEAIEYAKKLNHPIFQSYINGVEVSVDAYIDKNGLLKGNILRRREVVVNGESQITSTFYDEKINNIIQQFVQAFTFYGHIVLQLFIDNNNQIHIIECNTRFGGASTLSIEAGLDSFYWFFLESMGEELEQYPFRRSEKEIKMVRYPSDTFIKEE